ncbi:tRNA (adenosine(37)-N6)-threonylcarbamoyltransferase complex transferase subunit TsaD [Neolewinella agarilytica]|uniref:tRNA N6-adenosine threonylcarbamoyltransferase n=1 Tax=Neolewinella agarilytica TaxID=478744 RepID=A0A1H9LA84_9BACT|nr:tRNA (adenosine(37)-N6)-threonylcarbamoyltransferase complex transferase subunit TsaD [Neolewinella agarilytica]SER08411.1 O-sialoglycoprotein endopeptidase [Neolewinella agarilytica]
MPVILAIESSCDDTSAAVVADGLVLSNVTAGQAVHEEFGGVVPEHASRAHQRNIVPTVAVALKRAAKTAAQIDAVAFTRGPGLIGSLMVGVSFAKGFALARGLPLIEVDHMQAHVLAHFAEDPKPAFPFLCLTVSGGHTQLVVVHSALEQEIIGRTIDDAAGEAFDKSGKLLGLPYPAGPEIDRRARLGQPTIEFAKPDPGELNFSFSGLKTSILYSLQKKIKEDPDFVKDNLNDICASIQHIIVSILLRKIQLAVAQTGLKQVALAGGVSANSGLRQGLQELGEKNGWEVFIPRIEYCTDNAAMIGVTATFKFAEGAFSGQDVAPAARF